MGFEQTKWVWMNGQVVAWKDATLHVSAHALHYGSGVFEGIRCYETEQGPALFRLWDHFDRLYASAAVYELEIPYSREQLAEATCELIQRNGFRNCYVRPICFLGSASLAVHPRQCPLDTAILTWPWAAYLGAEGLEKGVRITVSPWQKFNSRMMPTTAKACGQYLNSMLAVRDAVARGYDEAILLDVDGNIAEGSGENLFVIKNRKVITNDAQDSILMGITRDSVIEIARDLGYEVESRSLHLEDLLHCDEAFFTGTAAEVTPIRELDGQVVGGGQPGPITAQIQRIYFDATSGRNPHYEHWLYHTEQAKTLSTK